MSPQVSMSAKSNLQILSGVRLMLLLGFFGLLGLLGFAALFSIHSLRVVVNLNERSTRDYIARSEELEDIRGNAYTMSSRVRDFLLDREPASSERHRDDALAAWERTTAALAKYRQQCPDPQLPAFRQLYSSLVSYWAEVEPALKWDEEARSKRGYAFLSDQLTPRRDEFFRLLDELRRSNEVELRSASDESARLIQELQQRMSSVLIAAFIIGLALAAITGVQFFRMERSVRLRYQASLENRAQLEALSARLLDIQEDERRRISRELHDEAGQALSGLLVDVANASAAIGEDHAAVRERLESVKRAAESTLASIRNLSLLLRPSMLDDLGLIPALRWQARETARRTGMNVAVDADDAELELPDEYRTTIYRVVQEALNNAARHSGAENVSVTVRAEPARLLVRIRDDGKGFNPHTTRGMGLLGMHERIVHLKGRFLIRSEQGGGAELVFELPPVASGQAQGGDVA